MTTIDGSKRGTCWSITINNPTDDDLVCGQNATGWKDFISFEGQKEKGENGTLHIQGMLRTKSVKFSAVKKHFPRAHIEIAKSPAALEKYVAKSETRVGELSKTKCATVSTLNGAIRALWDISKYNNRIWDMLLAMRERYYLDEHTHTGLVMLDDLTVHLMSEGYYGIEYIAANPSVRLTWKKFWEHIVRREYASPQIQEPPAPEEDAAQSETP